jgi:hypothetical protein
MNVPLFTTVVEKFRGRSLVSFVDRWRRASWDRRMEKATADAYRLVEEYKRREARRHDRR